MDRREYVCNQMYKQHALLRKDSWTDADKLEYMELNIAPYSRYWRMGMKKALKHAIKLLREEEAKADHKTEPQIDSCEVCEYIRNCDADKCNGCCKKRKTEPTGDNLSAVEDEPQTEEWYTYQDEQEYRDRWDAEPQTERKE